MPAMMDIFQSNSSNHQPKLWFARRTPQMNSQLFDVLTGEVDQSHTLYKFLYTCEATNHGVNTCSILYIYIYKYTWHINYDKGYNDYLQCISYHDAMLLHLSDTTWFQGSTISHGYNDDWHSHSKTGTTSWWHILVFGHSTRACAGLVYRLGWNWNKLKSESICNM